MFDIRIWQVPLFCSYICHCQFNYYGCPRYLAIEGFVSSTVSNNTYVWLGISLIPKTNVIYVSYGTLDMFYILNLQGFCGSMER
jgi:hypothetical protein